jgi:subtilase family serine protease
MLAQAPGVDFQTDLYVSEKLPIRAEANLVLSDSIERLAPGKSIIISGLFFAKSGTSHLLQPVADVYDATNDQNPANNARTTQIKLPSK